MVLEFDKKLQNIKRFLENNKINLLGGENEESIFERRCRYSIRKLSVGACSLMIGAVLFAGPALAEETAVPENSGANTELVSGESEHSTNEADKQNEGNMLEKTS